MFKNKKPKEKKNKENKQADISILYSFIKQQIWSFDLH